ncbi:MAG: hypothetical protein ACKE51_06705 [Methylococcaceae bacterium]
MKVKKSYITLDIYNQPKPPPINKPTIAPMINPITTLMNHHFFVFVLLHTIQAVAMPKISAEMRPAKPTIIPIFFTPKNPSLSLLKTKKHFNIKLRENGNNFIRACFF